MKKKIRLWVLMFLLIVAFVTILTTVSKLDAESQQGHWLYDREGNKVGCKSPGKDCFWY